MTKSVLFVCNMNSVRSPMAAAILAAEAGDRLNVDSAGVYQGGPDPFIAAILAEIDVNLGDYEPKAVQDMSFDGVDVIVALTSEAAEEARRFFPREKIEFWPIENPSDARGGREALAAAYRSVRDDLRRRIRARFPRISERP